MILAISSEEIGSDEKIKVAEENGYGHVINYTKKDFVEEVMKITKNEGVPAVFDGVGKKTFRGCTFNRCF